MGTLFFFLQSSLAYGISNSKVTKAHSVSHTRTLRAESVINSHGNAKNKAQHALSAKHWTQTSC